MRVANIKVAKTMTNLLAGFQSEKAAQISSYFAQKNNAPIDKLKLMKLIYLSEREFMERYTEPMLYDEFFSLPHGPICSNTLNGINGELDIEIWNKFISRNGHKIKTTQNSFNRDDFDEISDAEIEVLNSTWDSFGWMTTTEIRNYTHKNCPEYTELEKGCLPIHYPNLFKVLGYDNPQHLSDEIDQFRKTEAMITSQ